MPRWPRPSRMLPGGQEHVALRKPQRSSGTGHDCSRRPMTPTLGDGRSKPGSAISRRGTPTGRDFFSKKWWRAFLRVASAPSQYAPRLGQRVRARLARLRRSVPRCSRRDRRRSCGARRDRTRTCMEHARDR
jgi:hypothetical protein